MVPKVAGSRPVSLPKKSIGIVVPKIVGSRRSGEPPRLPPFQNPSALRWDFCFYRFPKPFCIVLVKESAMYAFFYQLRSSATFQRTIFIILPLMHLVGFLGLQISISRPLFKALVPFHLLSSLILLLLFHLDWNRFVVFFCLVAYFTGFVVEALGVHTGMIFGQYHYGATLGWKVLDVPLIIGVNWLTLTYAVGIIANRWHHSRWVKALLAAGVVVGIDVLIEPVAVRLDFWSWAGDSIPFQNYTAWYVVAFGLLWLFYQLPFPKQNRLAGLFLVCQILFFLAHNLMYILE